MVTSKVGLGIGLAAVLLPRVEAFDFEQVREKARISATKPFQPAPTNQVPEALLRLNYVQHQSIRPKPQNALWMAEDLPFRVEFLLPGTQFRERVLIHEIRDGEIREVPFSAEAFDFGTNRLDLPPEVHYAGFRIYHAGRDIREIASFLGASYYRMAGRGHNFGASARGLALNTATLGEEEFPTFREFWLKQPKAGDKSLTLWARLDSLSVAGAFEFVITPAQSTVARVTAALFPRREVEQFGMAPVTSMFFYDENSHPPLRDFRPEVHDSDGLLMHTGNGEFLWRPLEAGKMMRVNAYHDVNPKGFGLVQRDRDFEHYQDLTAGFERRPTVWVQPLTGWGEGSVQLIQLPTDIEYTDNIVAFWVPKEVPKPGSELRFSYETHWLTNEVTPRALGRVRATRMGTVPVPDRPEQPNLRFVIDFDGEAMEALSAREQISAEFKHSDGTELVADTVVKNDRNGTWRLVLEITPPSKAIDLRACLTRAGKVITEHWVFTWQP